MGLREKVALVLIAVFFYQMVCSLSMTHPAEENPFEKYMSKIKKGKIKSLSKHANENGKRFPKDFQRNVHKASSFPKVDYFLDSFSKTEPNTKHDIPSKKSSIDVLSDSAFLNELRKEKRRKRKNKPNEKVYSRDDLPLTSLPENFRNQEFYFNEMGSFPEVQYPLTASETWSANYFNPLSSNNNVYYKDITVQNKKDKKKLKEAFLKPSIMREILEAQEKIIKNKSVKNQTNVEIDNKPIIVDSHTYSLVPKAIESLRKKPAHPVSRNKSIKKIVSKVQNVTDASIKLIPESGELYSGLDLFSKEIQSNKTTNNIYKSEHSKTANNKMFSPKDELPKNYNDFLTDNDLINTIQTFDPTSSHTTIDKESNQLELLLALTAIELPTEQNPSNETILETNDTPDSNLVLFGDSVRQRIFDVLSSEKLNESSLRDNILKILQAEEQIPQLADTLEIKKTSGNLSSENLTSVDIVEFPLTVTLIDIIGLTTEELSEAPRETNDSDDVIETKEQLIESIELITEKPLIDNSTTSREFESTSVQETPEILLVEPQILSSTEDVSDSIVTKELASDLRQIITKPSDSRALVDDLREIIRLLTIWNSQINDIDEVYQSTSNVPSDMTEKNPITAFSNSTIDEWTEYIPIDTSIDSTTKKWSETNHAVLQNDNIHNDIWTYVVPVNAVSGAPTDDELKVVPAAALFDTLENVAVAAKTDSSPNVRIKSISVDTHSVNQKDIQINKTSANIQNYSQTDIAQVATLRDNTSDNRYHIVPVAIPKDTAKDYQPDILYPLETTSEKPINYDQSEKSVMAAMGDISSDDAIVPVVTSTDTPMDNQTDIVSVATTDSNKTSVGQLSHISIEDRSSIVPVNTSSDKSLDDQTDTAMLKTARGNQTYGRTNVVHVAVPSEISKDNQMDKAPEEKLGSTLSDSVFVDSTNSTLKNYQPDVVHINTTSDALIDNRADKVYKATTMDKQTGDQSDIVSAVSDTLVDEVPVATASDTSTNERSDIVPVTYANDNPIDPIVLIPIATAKDTQTFGKPEEIIKDSNSDLFPEPNKSSGEPLTIANSRMNITMPIATVQDTQTFDEPKEIIKDFDSDLFSEPNKSSGDPLTIANGNMNTTKSHDTNESINKDAADSPDIHVENRGSNAIKTILEPTNDDTWPSELASFLNPDTVSLLAEEKEHSGPFMSFISNFLALANMMTDTNNASKILSDSDLLAHNPLASALNENSTLDILEIVFPDKGHHELTSSHIINVTDSGSEPTPDYFTDNVINSSILPVEFDETQINDISDFITDSNFNNTLSNSSSSTKFPSTVTINVISSSSSQNDTGSNPSVTDQPNEKKIHSDDLSIENICPIIEYTPLINQCYIYEKPDALKSTGNGTDILSGEIASAKNIDSIPENDVSIDAISDIALSDFIIVTDNLLNSKIEPQDSIFTNTSDSVSIINNDILDFTDYYTLPPEDITTDFYDVLSNEVNEGKYDQNSKIFTSEHDSYDKLSNFKEQDTSRLAFEPAIKEDSSISNNKDMNIGQDELETSKSSNNDRYKYYFIR